MTNPEVTIRKATLDDCDGLEKLMWEFGEWSRENYFAPLGLRWNFEFDNEKSVIINDIKDFIEGEGKWTLIAIKNGKIVGFINAELGEDKNFKHKKYARLHNFFVTKSERGKGIGREMLWNKMNEDLAKMEIDFLVLTTMVNNPVREFYEKEGFISESTKMVKKVVEIK